MNWLLERWGPPSAPVGQPMDYEVTRDLPFIEGTPFEGKRLAVYALDARCEWQQVAILSPFETVTVRSFVGQMFHSVWLDEVINTDGSLMRQRGDVGVRCIAGVEVDTGCTRTAMDVLVS